MTYRKFKSGQLFNGKTFISNELVLIAHSDGTIADVLPEPEAGGDIEHLDGILCPGFVNAHCHLELSFLKDKIKPHSGMTGFLLQVMGHQGSMREEGLEAMIQANDTMRANGIVAVGDISNTPLSAPVKAASDLYYHTFVETAGFVPAGANGRAAHALQVLETFQEAGLPASLSPHAPYSVSQELLHIINERTAHQLVSIHSQESNSEDLFFKYKKGGFLQLYEKLGLTIDFFHATHSSSLAWWLPHFNRSQQLLLVHNVCTTRQDFDLIHEIGARTGIPLPSLHFCLCPNANLYIQQLLPDPALLLKNNAHLVIGTDSYASNHTLHCWDEVCTLAEAFPAIPLEVFLRSATLNGAETLGIAHQFGSFDKGKKPGVLLLKGEKVIRMC